MATRVWGTLEPFSIGAMAAAKVTAEAKERTNAEGAKKAGLVVAVKGCGFCWRAEDAARERVALERRPVKRRRRKIEENSLKVR